MSFRALNWAWEQQGLSSVQKLVLVALADHAQEPKMECNPGLTRLSLRLCTSIRAIQNALKVLEDRKLVVRTLREGVGTTYRVTVPPPHEMQGSLDIGPPAPAASPPAPRARVRRRPVHHVRGTPAPGAPEPTLNQSPTVIEGSPVGAAPLVRLAVDNTQQHAPPQAAAPPPQDVAPSRGARLPRDWQPTAELIAFATGLRLDPAHLAANFRDYWHAKAGAGGRKVDWAATWRVWCRKEADRLVRPGRESQLDKARRLNDRDRAAAERPQMPPSLAALGYGR